MTHDDRMTIDENEVRSLKSVLAGLPNPRTVGEALETGQGLVANPDRGTCIVALDDDPTGTQSVHGVDVLTRWDVTTLAEQFSRPEGCFYILTNSRGMVSEQACKVHDAVAKSLRIASQQTGRPFTCISRSDSTLRGHYPAEMDALARRLELIKAVTVICPFFEAGGRVTVDDIHYVLDGDRMVPAAQTPFAADATFGYRHSNLRRWVTEKTEGRLSESDIDSFSVHALRTANLDALAQRILDITDGGVLIVNALAPSDFGGGNRRDANGFETGQVASVSHRGGFRSIGSRGFDPAALECWRDH